MDSLFRESPMNNETDLSESAFENRKRRPKRQLLLKKEISRFVFDCNCQLGDLYLCTDILYDDKATDDAVIKLFCFNRNHSCDG